MGFFSHLAALYPSQAALYASQWPAFAAHQQQQYHGLPYHSLPNGEFLQYDFISIGLSRKTRRVLSGPLNHSSAAELKTIITVEI